MVLYAIRSRRAGLIHDGEYLDYLIERAGSRASEVISHVGAESSYWKSLRATSEPISLGSKMRTRPRSADVHTGEYIDYLVERAGEEARSVIVSDDNGGRTEEESKEE